MSTVRFFVNNKRVSTAVHLENGKLLQVYPEHREYADQTTWESHWNATILAKPTIQVQVTPAKPKSDKPRKPREKPLAVSSDYEDLYDPVHNASTWICPACGRGPGNDHRMCICRAFNYSVEKWERACGIRM